MWVLGIDTSCDDTGVAVYDTARGLRAHKLYSQSRMHAEYGGVVPELASRDHIRRVLPLTRQVLDELPPLSDRVVIDEVNLVLEREKAEQYGIDRAPAIAVAYEAEPFDEQAPAASGATHGLHAVRRGQSLRPGGCRPRHGARDGSHPGHRSRGARARTARHRASS